MVHPCLPGLVRESLRDAGVAVGGALPGYEGASMRGATAGTARSAAAASAGGSGEKDDAGDHGGGEAMPASGASHAGAHEGLGSKQLWGFLGSLDRRTKELLVPSKIRTHKSLAFIPKDVALATVSVGSWVGVCVLGALMSVNVWVNMVLAGEQGVVNWTSGSIRVENSEHERAQQTWGFFKSVVDPVVGCSVCEDARSLFGCETLQASEEKRRAAWEVAKLKK